VASLDDDAGRLADVDADRELGLAGVERDFDVDQAFVEALSLALTNVNRLPDLACDDAAPDAAASTAQAPIMIKLCRFIAIGPTPRSPPDPSPGPPDPHRQRGAALVPRIPL
jgi:hypothetical protein